MARLCINTSPISSPGPFSPGSDTDIMSSPINVNAIARRLRMLYKNEEDDEVASIITLSIDEVLGDGEKNGEKSGHCLMRMDCLTASSGSTYSPYDDEEHHFQLPRDASERQGSQGTLDGGLLNHSIDYPESVEWDNNSETLYSRSEAHYSGSSVGYVKIALSAEIKSLSGQDKAFPLRQITYHSPTLPAHDSCDAPAFESVMLKRAETLEEVSMVEHLNSEGLRRDPWNPAVPLLAVVNANDPDDEAAVLILERLQTCDAVPCRRVRDVVDLTRQILQGLVFLHGQGIAHQGINPDTIMVETGDAPTNGLWERSEYEVRYYLVDFSHATGITDIHQVSLDLRHAAQSIKIIVGQTLPELSHLLHKMGNRESSDLTAAQALQELESTIQSIPASRMFAPLR